MYRILPSFIKKLIGSFLIVFVIIEAVRILDAMNSRTSDFTPQLDATRLYYSCGLILLFWIPFLLMKKRGEEIAMTATVAGFLSFIIHFISQVIRGHGLRTETGWTFDRSGSSLFDLILLLGVFSVLVILLEISSYYESHQLEDNQN